MDPKLLSALLYVVTGLLVDHSYHVPWLLKGFANDYKQLRRSTEFPTRTVQIRKDLL